MGKYLERKIRAYHGSNAEFTEFSNKYFGSATKTEQYGSGFYFANNIDFANNYGKNIYVVDLKINNPYILELGENTQDIKLTSKEIKELLKKHPYINAPADSEKSNPLGDWSDFFWENCTSNNPNLKENLEYCLDEAVNSLLEFPSLLNVDMFFEMSGVPKECFLNAVHEVTKKDGIIIKGENLEKKNPEYTYVVWDKKQIEIINLLKLYERD